MGKVINIQCRLYKALRLSERVSLHFEQQRLNFTLAKDNVRAGVALVSITPVSGVGGGGGGISLC